MNEAQTQAPVIPAYKVVNAGHSAVHPVLFVTMPSCVLADPDTAAELLRLLQRVRPIESAYEPVEGATAYFKSAYQNSASVNPVREGARVYDCTYRELDAFRKAAAEAAAASAPSEGENEHE